MPVCLSVWFVGSGLNPGLPASRQPHSRSPASALSLMRGDDEVICLCFLFPSGGCPVCPAGLFFHFPFEIFIGLFYLFCALLCHLMCSSFCPILDIICQSNYGLSWCDIFFLGGATRLSYEFSQVRKWTSSPYLPPPWTSVPSVDQQWETNQPESWIAGVTCSWQIPRKTPESFYFFFLVGTAERGRQKWRRDLRLAP